MGNSSSVNSTTTTTSDDSVSTSSINVSTLHLSLIEQESKSSSLYPDLNVNTDTTGVILNERQWIKENVIPHKNSMPELKIILDQLIVGGESEAVKVEWVLNATKWNILNPNEDRCYHTACEDRRKKIQKPLLDTDPLFTRRLVQYVIRYRPQFMLTIIEYPSGLCSVDSVSPGMQSLSVKQKAIKTMCFTLGDNAHLYDLLPGFTLLFIEELRHPRLVKEMRWHWHWLIADLKKFSTGVENQPTERAVLESMCDIFLEHNLFGPDVGQLHLIVAKHGLARQFRQLAAQKTVFHCDSDSSLFSELIALQKTLGTSGDSNSMSRALQQLKYAPYTFLNVFDPIQDDALFVEIFNIPENWQPLIKHKLLFVAMVERAVQRKYKLLCLRLVRNTDNMSIVFSDNISLCISLLHVDLDKFIPLFVQTLKTVRYTSLKDKKEAQFDEHIFLMLKMLVLKEDLSLLKTICAQMAVKYVQLQSLYTDYATDGEMKQYLSDLLLSRKPL